MTSIVRKKPCPYCGKKLQAANKLKWRNNLARHLGNTCAPYQRRMIEMGLDLLKSVAEWAITGRLPLPENLKSPDQIRKEEQEIRELETLYAGSFPPCTQEQSAQNSRPINPKEAL